MSILSSSTATTTPTPLMPIMPLHSRTNESIALIVQVRLKQSGLEPLITSHEFSRVSSLLFYTKPYQRGLLSNGARASDLYPLTQEPHMSAAAFDGTSHENHCLLGKKLLCYQRSGVRSGALKRVRPPTNNPQQYHVAAQCVIRGQRGAS